MKQNWFQNSYILKLSLGYLMLPFIIFCLSFIKIWIGLPIVVLLSWITWRIWKQNDSRNVSSGIAKNDLFVGLAILGFWVFLSGIGGFTFQNSDHHIRNAIFKDLINFKWPVIYPNNGDLPNTQLYALIYYIGHWLPAALVGKIFGWQPANIFLFMWTWLGIFLTTGLLKERVKSTLSASALLLIFFSGMDILGTLAFRSLFPNMYPTLWPPITYLQAWGPFFQFSAITTQLFSVFNQAVPTWICIALILNNYNRQNVFFIWALCFFFSLAALGLLPFTFLVIPRKAINAEDISSNWRDRKVASFLKDCLSDVKDMINPVTLLGGGLVFITTYLYFSTNLSASRRGFVEMDLYKVMFLVFYLTIEVLLLWILFFKEHRKNLWWYVTGGMFVLTPLIRFGSNIDFCMRASIPAIFILMTISGEALFRRPKVKYRAALILLLVIGAFTPIYEMNRSIYRTGQHYLAVQTSVGTSIYIKGIEQPNPIPELDHPSTLTADLYPSLSIFNPEDIPNYVGKINDSLFFKYLANSPDY